jgi:Histidine biosynthesis protein
VSLPGRAPDRKRGPGTAPVGGVPRLVPCLLLRRGRVCLPGPDGPVPVRSRAGPPLDPFDVIDRLSPQYDRLYLVDLDGIERGSPQLEYIQELSRDMDLWVDAGVPSADAAIDILVAGAQRAVLSSSHLRGPVELRRAWKLSTDWVFETEIVDGAVRNSGPLWESTEAVALAQAARAVGIADVVVSPREKDPDWGLVRLVAAGGPTWVDGSFTAAHAPRLAEAGAAGGIFHLDLLLADLLWSPPTSPLPDESVSTRDDED